MTSGVTERDRAKAGRQAAILHEAARLFAERGFSGVSRPRFDGRVYVVDAVSPTGVPMRLFVDPAAGAIVGRQRIGAPESYARLERPGGEDAEPDHASSDRNGRRAHSSSFRTRVLSHNAVHALTIMDAASLFERG